MRKFNVCYGVGLVVFGLSIFFGHVRGQTAALLWSLWINALLIFIIVKMASGIKAHEVMLSPGFQSRYADTFRENLDLWEENTRLSAELEWIKNAPEPQKVIAIPRQDPSGRFIAQDGVSTKEKRVRSYLLSQSGKSDSEIADILKVKESSVPVYRSQGRKIVEPFKDLVAGMPLERAISFFCGDKPLPLK